MNAFGNDLPQGKSEFRPVTLGRRKFIHLAGWTAAAAASGTSKLLFSGAARADGTVQRPIEDFLEAQGTTSIFTPPLDVGDYVAWFSALTRPPVYGASIDYAGIANEWVEDETNGEYSFETATRGNVIERKLSDGRAEVTVVLRADNALTWGVNIDPMGDITQQLINNPPVFGARLQEFILDPEDTPIALGNVEFKIVFKNTEPGDDLPDIVEAFILGQGPPEVELISVACRARSSGPLRALFGVPEGSPGMLTISQTGLFMTGFNGAVGDGFPAEQVQIRRLGQ